MTPNSRPSGQKKGFFEPEQIEAVLKHFSDDVQPLLTCACITGRRIQAELMPLRWDQVDFSARTVRLEPGMTKHEQGRIFYFTAGLGQILEARKAKADALKRCGRICFWVFHRNGKPIKSIKNGWKEACRKAGLPGNIPHDFRCTAVRNLIRCGISEGIAMEMT